MAQKFVWPLGISATVAIVTLCVPSIYLWSIPLFASLEQNIFTYIAGKVSEPLPFSCLPHAYTTEIISLDPLFIYIHDFISPTEVTALLEAGEAEFKPSEVFKHGRQLGTSDRTSSSARLPLDHPAVRCVLDRAQEFMGTMLDPRQDEIGPPQLVRYTSGQRFNIHHDWYDRPQPATPENRHRGSSWNRIASFFAILQDNCTEGETHFPYLKTVSKQPNLSDEENPVWRKHENGGLISRPVRGNAIFWVNLFANGTGDRRTMHAGLPVGEGLKTAMNIWPRQYYP